MDTDIAFAPQADEHERTTEDGLVGMDWEGILQTVPEDHQRLLGEGRPTVTAEAEPRWAMNSDNEAEFAALIPRLRTFRHSDLAERFREAAHTMIIPALTVVAERVGALGHDCQTHAVLDEPIPAVGQVVFFTFDARYQPGEQSLCFRLSPGESGLRVDMPGAGAVRSVQLQLAELRVEMVQRLAIDYLKTQLR